MNVVSTSVDDDDIAVTFEKFLTNFLFFGNVALRGLVRILATESSFRPTVHAASRQGTPSLTPLPKDDEESCEVRPPRSPIRSLTSLDRA